MTRGKHGAAAAKRHEHEALQAEVAELRHELARAQSVIADMVETHARRETAWTVERRALTTERDDATSPRLHALEDRVVDLTSRLAEAEKVRDEAKGVTSRLTKWLIDHFTTAHGMKHADGLELLWQIGGGAARVTDVGVVNDRSEGADATTPMVTAVQRARGLRK